MKVFKRYTFDPKTGALSFPPKRGEVSTLTEAMGFRDPSGDLTSIILEEPLPVGFDIHDFVRRTWPSRHRWHAARFPDPITHPGDGVIPALVEWSIPEDLTQQKPRVPRN